MIDETRNLKGGVIGQEGSIGTTTKERSTFLTKCFGYLFLAIIITFATAIIMNFAFVNTLLAHYQNGDAAAVDKGTEIYLWVVIGAAIAILIVSFIINRILAKGKRSLTAPYVIYSVLMGILMGAVILFVDYTLVFIALGITSICFAAMALIARITRKLSAKPFIIAGLGSLLAAALLTLVWVIVYFTNPEAEILQWFWIDYLVIFMVSMFTIVDMKKIDSIAKNGEGNKNLALYCALKLFNDFIYLFIRILILLAKTGIKVKRS